MLKNWNPPHFSEGFHEIIYIFSEVFGAATEIEGYTVKGFLDSASNLSQDNEHHSLTLGEHCKVAGEYISEHHPENSNLITAAQLHDNGKLYTRTDTNIKGIPDGNAHYYQHHCVGAYYAMLYLRDLPFKDIADVTNLIYYHMHPYTAWKQSERAMRRDKLLLGDNLFEDVMRLHEADKYAK